MTDTGRALLIEMTVLFPLEVDHLYHDRKFRASSSDLFLFFVCQLQIQLILTITFFDAKWQ